MIRPTRPVLRWPVLLAAFALLATACASVPPAAAPDEQAERLGLEPPPAWSAADPDLAPLSEAEREWWRLLGDERLPELIAEALEHNRDLAAAAARVEAAAAQARIAGADLSPQVGGRFDASRRRQNFLGFPIPGGDEQVLSTTNTSFQAALDVSWEIDLWGRLRASRGAARARFEATQADLAAARLSIAGRTAQGWFAAREAAAQLELATATLESRGRSEERLQRRYENGIAAPLDLRQATVARAEAAALVAQRRRQLDAARRAVELLLGRYPAGEVGEGSSLAEGADADALPPAVPVGLPAELLVRRPDLAAAERRLAAAGLGVSEARAALLPRISLTGSAGRSSEELDDLLDSDFSVWSLAAGVLQPIFQGGRLRAAVDLAEANQREALEGYAAAALTAFSEVELALAADRYLAEQVAALAEAAEQAAGARDLAEERYLAGLVDYLTVLDGQRRAFAAESSLIAARRERLAARVDLHLALGGGFATEPTPLDDPVAGETR